jgi:hypothetical protein
VTKIPEYIPPHKILVLIAEAMIKTYYFYKKLQKSLKFLKILMPENTVNTTILKDYGQYQNNKIVNSLASNTEISKYCVHY